jgi:hypothetical protein
MCPDRHVHRVHHCWRRPRPRRLPVPPACQLATLLWRTAPPGKPQDCCRGLCAAAAGKLAWRRRRCRSLRGAGCCESQERVGTCSAPAGCTGPVRRRAPGAMSSAAKGRGRCSMQCQSACDPRVQLGRDRAVCSQRQRANRAPLPGCGLPCSCSAHPTCAAGGPTAAAAEAARWQEGRGLPAARIRASAGTGTSKASRQVCASQQGSPQAQSTSSSRALTGPAQASPLPGPRCALLLGPPCDDGALLVL